MAVLSTLLGVLEIAALAVAVYIIIFQRSIMRWGATPEEANAEMPGDDFLDPPARCSARFTRAVSIDAPPEAVWPWICQVGRGAGWYAYDRLDNRGKKSADHIVDWIPEPQVGDALAIGHLALLEPGRLVAYEGAIPAPFFGARMRMALTYLLKPTSYGTRLVARVNIDFEGPTAWPVLRFFEVLDFMIVQRQSVKLKRFIEGYRRRLKAGDIQSDRRRTTYQAYEVIYADGSGAGVPGLENARMFRAQLEERGLVTPAAAEASEAAERA